MNLTYAVLANGHEYIGETEVEVTEDTNSFTLTKARRLDLIRMPMQTPNGVVMGKQIELLPIALSDVKQQSLFVTRGDLVLWGSPDQQIIDLYNRVIYGVMPASPEETRRILTGDAH